MTGTPFVKPTASPERASRDELITQNQNLAYWLANRHALQNPTLDADDVRQEALMALVNAASTYEPGKGKFSSYASQVIRNRLGKLSYRAGTYTYRGKPSPYRISKVELDAPVGDEEDSDDDWSSRVAAPVMDPAQVASVKSTHDLANQELGKLDPRARKAVTAWMHGKTYDEIGQMLKMTKMGAHKVVQNAMAQMRQAFRHEALEVRRVNQLVNALLEDTDSADAAPADAAPADDKSSLVLQTFTRLIKDGLSSSDALAHTAKKCQVSWDQVCALVGLEAPCGDADAAERSSPDHA